MCARQIDCAVWTADAPGTGHLTASAERVRLTGCAIHESNLAKEVAPPPDRAGDNDNPANAI